MINSKKMILSRKSVHPRDPCEATLGVYRQLGERYVRDIARFVPPELADFMRLLPRGGHVLDGGCAGGRDSKRLVRAGLRVTGIDLVKSFLTIARKAVPKARFQIMDARRLRLAPNTFDGIWANAVLLHLPRRDVAGVFRGFYTVLKDGGILHVAVKRGSGVADVPAVIDGKNVRRRFVFFSKREIERLLRQAGFHVLRSQIDRDLRGRKDVQWVSVLSRKSP